ncbi:MAG: RnfH family protein [Gammaproteobacteria bacterium]|nr:RnfH family protein [Gammaproteobacteria bacterium]MCY4211451.1 RnfH family protein [Gammaproteobacteria bacterium]MCY4281959.1 RnfH family protein [Gammaproteobacteria bacterium]MCY4338227.1 RnfH family protein [Gammaproteobacteria bacterium]
MSGGSDIEVEIVYGKSGSARVIKQTVPERATIRQAIEQSGILTRYPDIDLDNNKVGIFSRKKQLHDPVCAGDRIEIYQPLQVDPKEARRRRAKKLAG